MPTYGVKPTRIEKSKQNCYISDYQFIPSQKGRQLVMWRQYTYAQDHNKRRYYCSKQKMGCKARLKLGIDGSIESVGGIHAHPPPVYVKTPSGNMVRVS
ncbi:Modifier of mdg4 [Operophtera brumata]|uniref:Modifier of mdg4 n=1 Tax=Operophtera brumata TaxID=104452 RepID=A0A0L7KWG3_OPEBR|nr:Modifier of mdg4 [Operophtera brumata]